MPLLEALQSGACGWPKPKWKAFQGDLANLMLSLPIVNRRRKGSKGVGSWLPDHHRIWYVSDYAVVKLAYGLKFDEHEAGEIETVLLS